MNGIVLNGDDQVIESRAKAAGLALRHFDKLSASGEIPFDKTLFVEAGTVSGSRRMVPWDLLPVAWHFLERWDAAVPLWRYGVLAETLGTAEERQVTRGIVRDLRVLVHAVELVFVRKNAAGVELMKCWAAECASTGSAGASTGSPSTGSGGADRRLAFLRAIYRVKPRLCVLPRSWLAEVRQYDRQPFDRQPFDRLRGRGRPLNAGKPLVVVELEPGRLVKVYEGDEERVKAHFERQRRGRG